MADDLEMDMCASQYLEVECGAFNSEENTSIPELDCEPESPAPETESEKADKAIQTVNTTKNDKKKH